MSDIKMETEFMKILKRNHDEGDCKLIFKKFFLKNILFNTDFF